MKKRLYLQIAFNKGTLKDKNIFDYIEAASIELETVKSIHLIDGYCSHELPIEALNHCMFLTAVRHLDKFESIPDLLECYTGESIKDSETMLRLRRNLLGIENYSVLLNVIVACGTNTKIKQFFYDPLEYYNPKYYYKVTDGRLQLFIEGIKKYDRAHTESREAFAIRTGFKKDNGNNQTPGGKENV